MCVLGDEICSDCPIDYAIGCLGFVGAMRQISTAGAMQAGRPAQSKVVFFDLCNKIRKENKNEQPLFSSSTENSVKLLQYIATVHIFCLF